MSKVFKERLFILLKELSIFVIGISVPILAIWGLTSLPHSLGSWMILICMAFMLLVGLIGFVHWLIVEPIKFSKWYQNRKSDT